MDKSTATKSGQWAELFNAEYAAVTTMLSLGVALFAFTGFVVSTALPSAVKELQGAALMSWAQSLYLASAIVSGVATAMTARRFGVKKSLLIATLVFLLGTVLCVFAPTMPLLLAGRTLQGLAAGFIEAQCYALIFALFPQRLVAKVFGAEAVVWVTAAFAGPALAGFVTEYAGWRMALAISLPLALAFITLALPIAGRAVTPTGDKGFPGMRLGLVAIAMILVTSASIATPVLAGVTLVASGGLIFAAARIDHQAANRLLPQHAFTLAVPHGLGFWVTAIMPIAEGSTIVFLIYGLQDVFALKPAMAGLYGSLIAISWSFTQIAVSNYAGSAARRQMVWIGATSLCIGLALTALGFALGLLWLVALSLLPVGAAFGMNWGNLSELLIDSAAPDERDRVAALLPTTQTAGFGIGAALMGLVGNLAGFTNATTPQAMQQVMTIIFSTATLIALPAALAAWHLVSKRPKNIANE